MIEKSNNKQWILTVKYLPDVGGYDVSGLNIGDFSFIVEDGPDGEIGLPGNVAKSCGWDDGEILKAFFDDKNNLVFEKLMENGAVKLS